MRRAYIGISSPIAYFYDSEKQYFDDEWEWNPILESPQGLVTLFDELWFLSRALCPANLRKASFVKFINEDSAFEPLLKGVSDTLSDGGIDGLLTKYPYVSHMLELNDYSSEQFPRYNEIISQVFGHTPSLEFPIDNHSAEIKVAGNSLRGNSMRVDFLAFDTVIVNSLAVGNVELVTNSFNHSAVKIDHPTFNDVRVSEGVTIKHIPVLQTPGGPVIDRIERLRESKYLIDFRNKIISQNHREDCIDLVTKIETEFKDYRNTVLLDRQKGTSIFSSISKNALGYIIGNIAPGSTEAAGFLSDMKARKFNWTGFIAELERSRD